MSFLAEQASFYAGLSSNLGNLGNVIAKYDDVGTNVGGAYDSSTGMCPSVRLTV